MMNALIFKQEFRQVHNKYLLKSKFGEYTFILLLTALSLLVGMSEIKAQVVNGWEKIDLPFGFRGTDDFYLDVFFLPSDPNYGWVCGYNSKILLTTDGGKTWKGTRIINTSNQLETIQFLNNKVGYASGSSMLGSGNGSIYKSVDGGNFWFDISPTNPPSSLWGFNFIDENYGIVLGGDCNLQYFYLTTDGGKTWRSKSYNSSGGKLSDPLIIEKNGLCYAIGSGTLWQSNNGGIDWFIASKTGKQDWHEELAIYGNSIAIPFSETCEGTTSNNGGIRFSTDKGKTWSEFQGVKGPMFGTFLIDENTAWAAGFYEGVYFTCNSGKNWNLVDCGLKGHLDDIWFINDTTGWVVGDGVYRTTTIYSTSQVLIKDTVYFCEGTKVQISSDTTYKNQRWLNLNCTNSKYNEIDQSGEYIVYNYNTPCDPGLIVKTPARQVEKPKFNLSSSKNSIPCVGDTIVLSLNLSEANLNYKIKWSTSDTTRNIIVTQSGQYTVEVENDFGCKSYDTLDVIFNALPQPEIELIGRTIVCIGDSILLNSKNIANKYEWIEENTSNILSTNRQVYIKKEGKYKLRLTNSQGCTLESDFISLSFINDSNRIKIIQPINNTLNFGQNPFDGIICQNITLKNISNEEFVIDSVYLFKKFNFSIPASQLPIILSPNKDVSIETCFYSDKIGKFNDTLRISDICENKLIYLTAESESFTLSGENKCHLPWEIQARSLEHSYYLSVSPITPNPNEGNINFTVFEYVPSSEESQNIDILIYNSLGQLVSSNSAYPNLKEKLKYGETSTFNLNLHLEHNIFPSGVYYLVVASKQNSKGQVLQINY